MPSALVQLVLHCCGGLVALVCLAAVFLYVDVHTHHNLLRLQWRQITRATVDQPMTLLTFSPPSRYVGVVDVKNGKDSVELRRYPKSHPFAALQGSDNIIAFTTQRCHKQPLISARPRRWRGRDSWRRI